MKYRPGGFEFKVICYEHSGVSLLVEGFADQIIRTASVASEACKESLIHKLHRAAVKLCYVSHFLITLERGSPNSTTITRAGKGPSERPICSNF